MGRDVSGGIVHDHVEVALVIAQENGPAGSGARIVGMFALESITAKNSCRPRYVDAGENRPPIIIIVAIHVVGVIPTILLLKTAKIQRLAIIHTVHSIFLNNPVVVVVVPVGSL